ncbi:citrate/2-methylcitrate synthase, partial [Reichenbachiella sp.]
MAEDTAEIKVGDKSIELPLITGTENETAINIGALRAQSGLITLDPGYKNTGATRSAITFLDGEKGILRYRGYSIEELAEKSTFLEVAYLLIYGELPDAKTQQEFNTGITHHTLVHEDIKKILEGFPSNAHPMGVLSSLVTSLTAFYPESLDPNRSADAVDLSIIRILAKMPTFAAWAYK